MRTKTEIIREFNQVQTLCDRLIMDIGQGYARTRLTNDNSLVATVNQKIEAFKKAEAQLRTLEQELANSSD
ncbi:MAG: hypothetical protein HY063_05275 [Bacteroidetes bacterium]|nr:hypothetical protein [Bacteroidota bacterium]